MIFAYRTAITALLLGAISSLLPLCAAHAGPKLYIGNFKDNTVSVIDSGTSKVTATIPVAAGPHGMAISRDGKSVYVSGDGSSQLNIIDAAADKVVKTIEVGKSPHGIALTPDGRRLLVTVNGDDRMVFVDTGKGTVTGSVAIAKPHTVAVRPDGKFAYVSSQQPGKFALVVVDLAKSSVVRSIAVDKPPRDLEFAFNGKALYFTLAGTNAVQVLDPATDKIVGEIPTGVSPHLASWYAGTKVGLALVQGPSELLFFDLATNKATGSITVGKQPHWMTVSSDGKMAYVTNEGSNDISIVDLATQKVETVAVGNAPRKIVVQPATAERGAKASINSFAFAPNKITIRVGESMTWTNDDGSPHTVTFNDKSNSSGDLLPGQSFARVFDKPGTYAYHCAYHEYMTGFVVVQRQTAAKN